MPHEPGGNGKDRRGCGNERGFTLIETLVAVMILAVSLVVIMELFSGGIKSKIKATQYTTAVFHAKEKMEEVLSINASMNAIAEGEFSGEFEDGYAWMVTIDYMEPPEDERPLRRLDRYRITVDIRWLEGNHERHVDISTVTITEKGSVR